MKKTMVPVGILVIAWGAFACSDKSASQTTQQQVAQSAAQPAVQAGTSIPGMEGLPPGCRCTDVDDDTGKCEEAIDPKTHTVYDLKHGSWKVDHDDTLKAQQSAGVATAGMNMAGMEGLPPGCRCTDVDDDTGKCEEAIDPRTKTVYELKYGSWKVDQDDTLKAQGKILDD